MVSPNVNISNIIIIYKLQLLSCRQKVHKALVKDIQRHILDVAAVAKYLCINRRRHAHPADIQRPRLDIVNLIVSQLSYAPALNSFSLVPVEWAQKAKRRRTTGTGRMRHMKDLPRRFKNGFREGTTAKPMKASQKN